jgi:hypothetical protein
MPKLNVSIDLGDNPTKLSDNAYIMPDGTIYFAKKGMDIIDVLKRYENLKNESEWDS